jgi:hypothetical protein
VNWRSPRFRLFLLLPHSLKVSSNIHVNQSDPLGLAGTTGWSTGVHLHFQVEDIPQQTQTAGWWWTQSRPVSFANPEVLQQDANGIPQGGQSFDVSNSPVLIPTPTATPTPSPTPPPTPVPTPTPPNPVLVPTPTPPPTPAQPPKLTVNPSSIDASNPSVCPNGKCEITLSSPNSNTLNIDWKATITIRSGAGTGIIGSVSPSSGTLAPGQVIIVSFIISSDICGDITGSTITFAGGVSPVVVQLSGSFGPC